MENYSSRLGCWAGGDLAQNPVAHSGHQIWSILVVQHSPTTGLGFWEIRVCELYDLDFRGPLNARLPMECKRHLNTSN